MSHSSQNLVLLFRYSVESVREEDFLVGLISDSVTPDTFCQAHELAGRNRITRKKYKILRAFRQRQLPSFHFLINRN